MTDSYTIRCIEDVERSLLSHALGTIPVPVRTDAIEELLREARRPDPDEESWGEGFDHAIRRMTALVRRLGDRYDVGSVHYGHFAEILEALDELSANPE